MLNELFGKMMDHLSESDPEHKPESESPRGTSEMHQAKTEAQILKAEEDFKKQPRRSTQKLKKSKAK